MTDLNPEQAAAMTVNERLFAAGLLGACDRAAADGDIAGLRHLLSRVHLATPDIDSVVRSLVPVARLPECLAAAVAQLEPILGAMGFRPTRQREDPEAFGSALVEYRRAGDRLRLVWDGKEGALWAETAAEESETWLDVEAQGAGRPPRIDRDRSSDRLERLRRAIEASVGGRPTTG
jgi:hypothetical protein